MTKRRTAAGELVDFDLVRVKSQIATDPTPTEVHNRQQIINKRLRRKMSEQAVTTPEIDVGIPPKVVDKAPTVDNTLPEDGPEQNPDPNPAPKPIPEKQPQKRRQKANKQTGEDDAN